MGGGERADAVMRRGGKTMLEWMMTRIFLFSCGFSFSAAPIKCSYVSRQVKNKANQQGMFVRVFSHRQQPVLCCFFLYRYKNGHSLLTRTHACKEGDHPSIALARHLFLSLHLLHLRL
jgi:hypothetical protein